MYEEWCVSKVGQSKGVIRVLTANFITLNKVM
ncbi:hypothetical protein Holit_00511 [Hollandina sp. SP2]